MTNLINMSSVPLLQVGEDWRASTGVFTVTQEDLQAAVDAQNDPEICTPVIKFGHKDKRFPSVVDGEPAFGKVTNLHMSENGMTLLGDFTGVPQWLAACMASAYPRRSIEGKFNWKTTTGKTHKLALSAVALLGTEYPAITTLADIESVYAAETVDDVNMVPNEELVAASTLNESERFTKVEAAKDIHAAMMVEEVKREYYESLKGSDAYMSCWIRQTQLDPNALIVEDDTTNEIYSIAFSINGEQITFSEPIEVKETYLPVNIAASSGPKEVVIYPTKKDSYRDTFRSTGQNTEETNVTPEQLQALGLPEDATAEDVTAKITELAELASKAKESETSVTDETKTTETPTETQTETPVIPDGAVLVDASMLEELKASAQLAVKHEEENRVRTREALMSAAIKDGKIPPARREHWSASYDRDPEGTAQFLAAAPAGLIPVEEIGHSQDVNASAQDDLGYDDRFLTPAEREKRDEFYASKGMK